jgi:hypothetical protein
MSDCKVLKKASSLWDILMCYKKFFLVIRNEVNQALLYYG